jgi:acetoin utilization deacetylase AcuC-like enzyme
MDIIYNDKHIQHNVGGLSVKREGEVQLSYWDMNNNPPTTALRGDGESPSRIISIINAITEAGLGSVSVPKDLGLNPILEVHDQDYVDFLKTIYQRNAELIGSAGPVYPEAFAVRHAGKKPSGVHGLKGYYAFDIYTPIVEGTWNATYWSAQCALTAAELVRDGAGVAYAACRPSGHHASRDLYGGFCFLNNAAIATKYLQQNKQTKVAILDIDFHHGNGTQAIFYSESNVLFCSLHGDPEFAFPYFTGYEDEIGAGAGEGYNHNWPLPYGTDDIHYLKTLDDAIFEIQDFHPSYLVISAGYDIGAKDPYGGFNITKSGIHEIGTHIASLSKKIPTLVIQEGGYIPELLGKYVVSFLSAFS